MNIFNKLFNDLHYRIKEMRTLGPLETDEDSYYLVQYRFGIFPFWRTISRNLSDTGGIFAITIPVEYSTIGEARAAVFTHRKKYGTVIKNVVKYHKAEE